MNIVTYNHKGYAQESQEAGDQQHLKRAGTQASACPDTLQVFCVAENRSVSRWYAQSFVLPLHPASRVMRCFPSGYAVEAVLEDPVGVLEPGRTMVN